MTEADTIEREEVARLNRDALVAVLGETNMQIASRDWNAWRPTQRVQGVIPGMPIRCECVATDGNLGVFVPLRAEGHNLGSAFVGHVHRFEWGEGETGCPPTLWRMKAKVTEKVKPVRKKKPTIKSIIDSL